MNRFRIVFSTLLLAVTILMFTGGTVSAQSTGSAQAETATTPSATYTVNTTAEPPTFPPPINPCFRTNVCYLRTAVAFANSNPGSTVQFSLPSNSVIMLSQGPLPIRQSMTILGPSDKVTVQTSDVHGIFDIQPPAGSTVRLENLTVRDGQGVDAAGRRGALLVGGNVFAKFAPLSEGVIRPKLEIVESNIINGRASRGGNIYTNNVALTLDNSSVTDGKAGISGGGIYANHDVNMIDTTVADNRVPIISNRGGGVSSKGGGISMVGGDLTVNGSSIKGNIVGTNSRDGFGGGIYYAVPDGELVIKSASLIGNNSAYGQVTAEGGGIYSTGTTVINGATIENNTLYVTSGVGLGGGVRVSGGTIDWELASFDQNAATVGGALYASQLDPATPSTIDNSTFTNNSARAQGGAIAASDCTSSLSMTNLTIELNQADVWGGGLAMQKCLWSLEGSAVNNNRAGSFNSNGCGGGVFSHGSEGSIDQTTIIDNDAYNGAGICNVAFESGDDTSLHSAGHLTIARSTIRGNALNASARGFADTYGGGVYTSAGNHQNWTRTDILQSLLVDNQAYYGGGYAVRRFASTDLVNSTVTDNSATQGGGIWTDNLAWTYMIHATIVENNAGVGGGVYLGGSTRDAQGGGSRATNSIIAANDAISSVGMGDCFLNSGPLHVIDSVDSDGSCEDADTIANLTLAALTDNGGATLSILPNPALSSNSAVIDQASACAPEAEGRDQRDFSRPAGSACDLGAVEVGGVPLAIRVLSQSSYSSPVLSLVSAAAVALFVISIGVVGGTPGGGFGRNHPHTS